MSFPRYPKYKPSGVEWLGEVPEHWDVWKLAHAFALIASGTTPKTDNREYYDDGDIPWVNTGDLNDGELEDCGKRITARALADHSSLKLYPAGSLLIAMYGATIGKLAMLRFPATVNQACCVFAGASPIVSKFMFYWFLGLRQQILSLATGGGQPNVSQDILRTLRVGCPDQAEQTKIASFLDRETSKIDGLVGEQRRLIELLKEKRQAVISHAVTKGLNPHAPLKPSGIEWLGDVPEHWEVKSLKRLAENIKAGPFGSSLTKDMYVSSGYRVYGQEQVIPNDFNVGDYFITAEKYEELSQYRVAPRDILISCVGTFGKIAIVPDAVAPGIINPRLLRLRCSNAISAEYLAEVLRSLVTFEQFALLSRGGTMDVINIGTLNAILVAVPPIAEQNGIVGFLDTETAKFDALTAEADRGIELLQERRTALISAAVTGQIDVRGLVATEAA